MVLRTIAPFLAVALFSACGNDDADPRDMSADVGADGDVADDTGADGDVADDTGADGDVADSDSSPDTSEDTSPDTSPDTTEDTADGDVIVPPEGARLRFVPIANPVDLTPDGTRALLWDNSSELGAAWSFDVATGDTAFEAAVGPTFRDFPTAVSADFDVTALYGEPVAAGVWSRGTGWRDLGSAFPEGCGLDMNEPTAGDIGGAWDISADGSVVVGLSWDGCRTEAFRWTPAGFAVLASPEGAAELHSNRATVVSDDGRVAAGFAQTDLVDRWPAVWDADGLGRLLETELFPADAPGEVLAISADGRVLAGTWNQRAFLWSEADGVVDLGTLPDADPSDQLYANAVAAGGQLVFGSEGGLFSGPVAWFWTRAGGVQALQPLLASLGLEVPDGVVLTNVLAASDDGAVIIGSALDATFAQLTFVLELPISAYGF